MFICHILCAAALISGALAWIPYNEVEFELLDGFPKTMESQALQVAQTTKNFFSRKDVDCLTEEGVTNYAPYMSQITATLPVLQNSIGSESDWKQTLRKVIPDGQRRGNAENDIRTMEETMRTIAYNIGHLNPNKNLSIESKGAVVHNIHDCLETIISKFAQRPSIFRKYPLIAMPILFALASFVSLFVHIEGAIVPELAKGSLNSCKLFETLLEYRLLAAESRLLKLEIVDSIGAPINKRNPINNILAKPYNEYGYNQTNDCSISCRIECKPTDGEYVYVCLKDPISGTEYDCNKRFEMYGCLFSYMEYVRYQVENTFTDPIKMTLKSCSLEARNRPRYTKTGYGWWEIMFLDAITIEDANGHSCDDWDDCDAYIKVFIDGREVFRTDHKLNNHMPYYGDTYRSPKMLKTARITIEMWDEDSSWIESDDDLILRWETNIDALLKNGIHWSGRGNIWKNKIVTASTWKDDYPDWELHQFLSSQTDPRDHHTWDRSHEHARDSTHYNWK